MFNNYDQITRTQYTTPDKNDIYTFPTSGSIKTGEVWILSDATMTNLVDMAIQLNSLGVSSLILCDYHNQAEFGKLVNTRADALGVPYTSAIPGSPAQFDDDGNETTPAIPDTTEPFHLKIYYADTKTQVNERTFAAAFEFLKHIPQQNKIDVIIVSNTQNVFEPDQDDPNFAVMLNTMHKNAVATGRTFILNAMSDIPLHANCARSIDGHASYTLGSVSSIVRR
jgi:hypothetical protein